jgi:hypothetical protein
MTPNTKASGNRSQPPSEPASLRLYLEDAEAVDNLFHEALDKQGAKAFRPL